ncbi:EAL domain-containing response regulator [Cupriavidus sp. IDO]|uniref:EAL domain-containing response regulator n=1 Tax=Cupriavidus sp. IDO TaxID=1539142 RepID=UPI000578FFC0|nr:EAL domain-containing protein [Cupriavidus sp. IDO]KWR90227.1 diguanylate phosphodiesterase [Cupriavidus sp. IDO]
MPSRYAALRILVVEDHPFQRVAAEGLLRRLGVRDLHSAANGCEAAALLAEHPFDVVICDIEMPGGNGPELIAELRQRGLHALPGPVPVWVWVTALADDILDSHRSLAFAAGFSHVHALHKPLAGDAIEEILADTLALNQRTGAHAPRAEPPDDAELLAAVQTCEAFMVVLQPQFDIATNRMNGAEALIRWRHPTLGLIRPDDFIPRLEQLDAAAPIFFHVLEACLAAQQQLLAAGIEIPLGINASPQTLCQPGLLERLDERVGNSGVPRSLLTIELTEGFPISDTLALSVTLNRLRLLGYGVAIDDFGLGIATLKLLADLPFTQIKLDRSFVGNVADNDQRAAICRNMINMANDLGLECVAEGVETEIQRAALQTLHCGTGQGYLWSAPKPVDAFVADAISRNAQPDA